jgi:bacteriocin biosynthesis cyclodehydratase domain-containing protein
MAAPVDPIVLELADHAVVIRRSAAELQVGLDPGRALIFPDGYRPLLDQLRAPMTRTGLLAVGRAAGLATGEVTEAVRRLGEAGLLRTALAGPRGRTGRRVRLVGAGPIGLPLARYLVEGGIGELAVFESGPADPGIHGAARSVADLAAAPGSRGTRFVPLDHWSKPETLAVDLTVVVAAGPEVDRLITDHLLRTDQPHLLVRSLGDAVWVGPLVLPGRTACVRCTDLIRTDADPGWPTVLAQLVRLQLGAPDLLTGWAASVAAAQVLAFVDGGRPETTGATLELSAADLRTELRTWPNHPECGCRWPASTEWGP